MATEVYEAPGELLNEMRQTLGLKPDLLAADYPSFE